MSDEDFENCKSMSDFRLSHALMDANLPISNEDFLTIIDSWQGAVEEYGQLVEYGEFEAEESGQNETTLKTTAEFENKQAEMEFQFDENCDMTGMTVNIKYTMGQILEKAGLNTLLGMGTVFAVLIFIAFIISLFRVFPYLEKRKAEKQAASQTVAAETAKMETDSGESAGEMVQNAELAAVIAAAVAAYEGKTSTDGLVVRSIRRHKSKKRR